jgi:hypothetical protein
MVQTGCNIHACFWSAQSMATNAAKSDFIALLVPIEQLDLFAPRSPYRNVLFSHPDII